MAPPARIALTPKLIRQGAQWVPRDLIMESSSVDLGERCEVANAPVAAVSIGRRSGDRCSRFLERFCARDWRFDPTTRHLPHLDCRYPDARVKESGLFLAQSVGHAGPLSGRACPDPLVLLWPPSKVTYPRCSGAINALKEARIRTSDGPEPASDVNPGGKLVALQLDASASGQCPAPAAFRWSPDDELWPECESWIRAKCAAGSPCSVGGATAWGTEAAQRSFAAAQDWAAGRGKCPFSLDGRWRPGPLFYPECSSAMAAWCSSRGASCGWPGSAGDTRRGEAQHWAHAMTRGCPDPEREFLWPWPLTLDEAEEAEEEGSAENEEEPQASSRPRPVGGSEAQDAVNSSRRAENGGAARKAPRVPIAVKSP